METDEYELEYEVDDVATSKQDSPRQMRNVSETDTMQATIINSEHGDVDSDPSEESSPRRIDESGGGVHVAVSTGHKGRKRPLVKDNVAILTLTRKVKHYKKVNAELRNQLQRFYQNDAIAFLENKAHEKQQQIDALQQENRALSSQQRFLAKQVEELQDTMEKMPKTKVALREELRICREQLRHYKDKQKSFEEQSSKNHQQLVDLMTKNKTLTEKLRSLESQSTPLSPVSARSSVGGCIQDAQAIIADQEDEITRLNHRVDVMKKTIRLERTKHEKESTACHDEVEASRDNLNRFQRVLLEKEKVIRSQYLQIKQLKRSVKDLVMSMQANQELSRLRDVRFANQPQSQGMNSSHASLPPKPVNAKLAHDTLRHLGLLQLRNSSSKASALNHGSSDYDSVSNRVDPENDAQYGQSTSQPRFVPCPPQVPNDIDHFRSSAPRPRSTRSLTFSNSSARIEEPSIDIVDPRDEEDDPYADAEYD